MGGRRCGAILRSGSSSAGETCRRPSGPRCRMWENYGDRGGVERVDDRPVAAVEGDMCAGSERLTLRSPELRLVVGAEARGLPLVEGHYDPIAERAEGLL